MIKFSHLHMLIVRWLIYKDFKLSLTAWESGFIRDIQSKKELSVLQDLKIKEIYGQYRHNKRTVLIPSRPYTDTYYEEGDLIIDIL